MEYAAMLSQPELIHGLRDLLTDADVSVVKRTVRVFTNVYRHALHLLAEGQLDEGTFNTAWPVVRTVADDTLALLTSSENEGIIIHVVRFLEAVVVAHLHCDLTSFPLVSAHVPKIVQQGVDALTRLISTPYIGGSAFLVCVRSLITVACYKHDLWTTVTNLIEQKIASPPATLFDHNVRSLHKILQRNLFRLLRRAEDAALRSQLIEMMVRVGVPRRMLTRWAPPPLARKRQAPVQSEDAIMGRITPPNKRTRDTDSDQDETADLPRDPRERPPRDPREPKDPRQLSREPNNTPRDDQYLPRPQDRSLLMAGRVSPPSRPSSKPNTPPASRCSTPTNGPPPVSKSTIMSNFEFLKGLISSKKKTSGSFVAMCSEKERSLYERMDHPTVVQLVLSCLDNVPDAPPEELLKKLGRAPGDVSGLREQLTKLLAPHINHEFITSLTDEEGSAPPSQTSSRPSSNSSSTFSGRASPPHSGASPPSPPSSARSTPSDTTSVCHSDVDLRKLLNRTFTFGGDVDMRDTRLLLPRQPEPHMLPHQPHMPPQSQSQITLPPQPQGQVTLPPQPQGYAPLPPQPQGQIPVPPPPQPQGQIPVPPPPQPQGQNQAQGPSQPQEQNPGQTQPQEQNSGQVVKTQGQEQLTHQSGSLPKTDSIPGIDNNRLEHRINAASVKDPRLNNSDPRLSKSDPRILPTDPRVTVSDPRVTVSDPRLPVTDPRLSVTNPRVTVSDPQIPVTDPRRPPTDPRLSASNPQVPASNPQLPTTSPHIVPTSDPRLHKPDPRVPTSDFLLPTSNHRVPKADLRLPSPSPRLSETNPQLQASDPRPPTTKPVLPTPDPELPVPPLGLPAPFSNHQHPRSFLERPPPPFMSMPPPPHPPRGYLAGPQGYRKELPLPFIDAIRPEFNAHGHFRGPPPPVGARPPPFTTPPPGMDGRWQRGVVPPPPYRRDVIMPHMTNNPGMFSPPLHL